MDLSTMSAKLDQGKYKDRSAFEQDFRLLINNAKQYNMPKSAAYDDALELEKAFDIGMSCLVDVCTQLLTTNTRMGAYYEDN